MSQARPKSQPCPCGSGRDYPACCQPYHAGQPAPDAEALMRSRYTAYALGLAPYLLATWHPQTRPAALDLAEPPLPKWLSLTVQAHQRQDDTHATVTFIARFRSQGKGHRLHETSRFLREDEQWYYVDGDIHP